MSAISSISALALALTFAVAGVSKLLRRSEVVASFRALRLPAAPSLATAVPIFEITLSVLLLTAPAIGAVLALVVLAVFSLVIVSALRRGVEADCGCFGAILRKPLSRADLVRNAFLAILAATVLASA